MLPLLPLLTALPSVIGSVSKIIGGSKAAKIKEAADTIQELASDVTGKKLPSEQLDKVNKIFDEGGVDMARVVLEYEKVKAADQADARALIRQESASEDPWVRRARPTFLWLMYGIIFWNFVVLGSYQYFKTGIPLTEPPLKFPEELYWLFGSAFLGYVGARSWDKKNKGGSGGPKELLKSLLLR